MMATTTHFKLGLLALVAVAALVTSALVLGLRKRPHDTYFTYFDESVQGLEPGAQVKYRGVQIGSVARIDIAPDRRHVQTQLAIDRERVGSLDLAGLASQLRTELVVVGITGLKVVEIDMVDPAKVPAPVLDFPPRQPYIASQQSLFKNVEEGLEITGDRLRVLVDRMIAIVDKTQLVIDEIGRAGIPQRVAAIADATGGALADVRHLVRRLDRGAVPDTLSSAITGLDRAARQLNQILARVDGNDGLLASARKATDSVGDLGRTTAESTGQLEPTLRELRDAARAVREFMDQLRREPDMLVKGRARTNRP